MDRTYTKIALSNVFILCQIRGIKTGEMEKAIGVSNGYLSKIKQCAKTMSFEIMVKISKYLDVSLDSLLEDEFSKRKVTLSVADLLNGDYSKCLRDLEGAKNE